MKVYYTNAIGLLNKMSELRLTLLCKSVDIACITETHFDSSLYESEIEINGYNCFRQDRNFKLDRSKCSDIVSGGGGSIIYVRSNISVEKITNLPGSLDSVAILIDCNLGKVLLSCMYRSPSLSMKQDEKLLSFFDCLTKYNGDDVEKLFMGDFNLTNVSWLSGSVLGFKDSVNSSIKAQRQYMDSVHNAGLSWLLTNEITRRRKVGDSVQESLLDQILCTEDSLINDFVIGPPLGKSDHVSIIMELNVANECYNDTSVSIKKHNWSKMTGFDIMELSSEVDWTYSKDIAMLTVEEMWQELHGKLNLVTQGVPFCPNPVSDSMNKYKMPWINSTLKRALKAKNKAWAVFDEEPCRLNLNLALSKQEIFEENETKARVRYEKKLTQNLKTNSKGFYSYLRNCRKVKSVVTSLEQADGSCTETDEDTAECFSEAFSSVFVREPMGPLPKECYSFNLDTCDNVDINEERVYNELKKLNIYKSMGPDDIHPKLLKSLAESSGFVESLTLLYQKCAYECKIPNLWKTANVVALHKKGSKKQALNYRPVSLTCILCKVYEQFIRSHVLSIVEDKINPNQHGFVNQKSCFSNILEAVDTIISMLEDGLPVDVFYFDFCKAFDSVPHYRLLIKLESFGITGPTLKIIQDFLSDRFMRTTVRGSYSKYKAVSSGVPQGSVLGPLLFVLFINDLPDGLKNATKLFADDLKLFGNASDIDSIEDDLAHLEKWQDLWLLKFNASKCKVMHLDFNSNCKQSYVLSGTDLEQVDSEKDLGILTNCQLEWEENIHSCIRDANRMIAWTTRNVIDKDKYVMLNIYKTLIRPKLEYCVQIWSPVACHGNWAIIIELEAVQRRFTRMINEIGLLPYSERLSALNLTTLAERRIRGDLIETFKVLSGQVEYGKEVFHVSRSGKNIISKGSISKCTPINKLRKSFISERVKPYWNSLPVSVKTSSSVEMFKANLESFKKECIKSTDCNFWEVSRILLDKIEGPSYVHNKERHNEYLVDHPYVAKKKNINIYHGC